MCNLQGLDDVSVSLGPRLANSMIGMGTWRLRDEVHPIVSFLVQRIEGTWREIFVEGVNC
jgi:hypothetical protein